MSTESTYREAFAMARTPIIDKVHHAIAELETRADAVDDYAKEAGTQLPEEWVKGYVCGLRRAVLVITDYLNLESDHDG